MQDPLDNYLSELIAAKGISDTPEVRAALADEVNEALDQALIEALPLAQLDKLEQATESDKSPDDEVLERLLVEAGVNPGDIINAALQDFRNNYLKGENNE